MECFNAGDGIILHARDCLCVCARSFSSSSSSPLTSGNYRYFVTFLFQTVLSTAYVAYLVSGMFLQQKQHPGLGPSHGPRVYDIGNKRGYVGFTFLVCTTLAGAVSMLASCHFYLVITGQTTIEFWGSLNVPGRCKKVRAVPGARHHA